MRYDAGRFAVGASPRMLALFSRFLDLTLMRLPPQTFPASRFLLGLVAGVFALVAFASNLVLSGDALYSLGRTVLSVVTLTGAAALILAASGRVARWQQTATSLLGGETVIGAFLLPVLLVRAGGIDNVFIVISLLLFIVWELIFLAHVYRNALDTGMIGGVLVAIAYVIASTLFEQAILPFPEPPA